MRKSVIWLALVLTAVTGSVQALEVGKIQVRSYLNEPLVATIPVRVGNIQERNSLAATLAAESEYVARGLPPLTSSDDLVIQVVEGRALEEMLIEIRSLSEVDAPFLSLILQMVWDGGNSVKEFTVLLDPAPDAVADDGDEPVPPGLAPMPSEMPSESAFDAESDPALQQLADDLGGKPVLRSSGKPPQVVIRKVSPDEYLSGRTDSKTSTGSYRTSGTAGDSFAPAAGDGGGYAGPSYTGNTYGPVAAGETLWGIASKVRPSLSVPMAQVMEAIFQANPAAFDGSYETLKKGARLTIPDAATMRASSGADSTSSPSVSSRPVAEAADTSEDKSQVVAEQPADAPAIWMAPERPAAVDSKQIEKKDGLVTKSSKAPTKLTETDSAQSAEPANEVVAAKEDVAKEDAAVSGAPAEDSPVAGKVDYSESDLSAEQAEPGSGLSSDQGETALGADQSDTESAAADADSALIDGELTEEASAAADDGANEEESAESAGTGGQNSTLILAAIILLVILFTYGWYRRRRSVEAEPAVTKSVAPLAEDEIEDVPAEAVYVESDDGDDDYETGIDGTPTESEKAEINKPASGADKDVIDQASTYLSYGLYESAAETLQKGIDTEPTRADYRMKLVETYETAGNAEEFVAAVAAWESSEAVLDADARSRIIDMGQRIAPGAVLFAQAGDTTIADSDFDTAAQDDQPVASPDMAVTEEAASEDLPLPDFDLDLPDAPAATSAEVDDLDLSDAVDKPGAAASEAESVALDFNLDDLPDTQDKPSADEVSEDLELPNLDFDLDDSTVPAAPVEKQASMDLDLDGLDLSLDDDKEDAQPALPTEDQDVAFELDDEPGLTLEEPAVVEGTEAGDEGVPDDAEYDVKIDLAQAYLDMGEPDLAKSLLEEVTSGGNQAQKDAAQSLLAQLD